MAEYRLTPRAQSDLDGVFDHSVAQWGQAQALRYTDAIAVERHIIYFRPTGYGIAVIRILHQRMDAPRHL